MTDTALFDSLYAQLNDAQRSAVDTIEGPVVVNAGPGTGKTQILTLRIANILREQGGDMAENILALTFTNAGVSAMRARLSTIIGSDAYRVGIFTFHSFAEYLIRQHEEQFTGFLSANLITDVERHLALESVILSGDYDILRPFGAPDSQVKSVMSAIDELKREAITPEAFREWNEAYKEEVLADEDSYYKRNGKGFSKGDLKKDALKYYEKNIELAQAYEEYEAYMSEHKLYDFNDVILAVVRELEQDEHFRYTVQEQFQYVLVDEHQDTNAAQNKIVEYLLDAPHLEGRPNIFTVGDDKQAIYRFQGASLANFLAFEERYRDVERITLEHNYRSGRQILEAAHSVISQDSSGREHAQLEAQHENARIECHEYPSYTDELHGIAREIASLIEQGVNPREIAVLYRENRHTDDIQKVLAQHQIASTVLARENILDTAFVQKILMLLSAISSLNDNHALAKLLYSDVFETDTYDVIKIIERFRRGKRDKETGQKYLFNILKDKKILKDIGVENVDAFLSVAQTLSLAHTAFASGHFMQSFDELMQQTGIISMLVGGPSSYEYSRYYDRLYEELRALTDAHPRISLQEVVSHFDTLEQYHITLDSVAGDAPGVRLLTAHKSKGLEYEYVFVTNLVDKVWGNKRSMRRFILPSGSASGDNDDERRLLYVSITRAKTHCYLSYARKQLDRETEASLFLFDIQDGLIEKIVHEESVSPEDKYAPVDGEILHTSVLDDEIIATLFESRALSVTALNNYLDCPAKYYINNLLQIPATYSRTLVYGSLMHRALELFFRESREQEAILGKDRLLEIFREAVEKEYLDEHEKRDILAKGESSLEGYWDTYHTQWSYRVENEMRINGVRLELGVDAALTLTGVLDKVEIDENGVDVRVFDYKTGKTFSEKSKDQKAALERQLVFYSLLLSLYRDGQLAMQSGTLDFIEPNKKTGEYEQTTLAPRSEDREALREEIAQMRREILEGVSFLDKRCGRADCQACTTLRHLG